MALARNQGVGLLVDTGTSCSQRAGGSEDPGGARTSVRSQGVGVQTGMEGTELIGYTLIPVPRKNNDHVRGPGAAMCGVPWAE